MGLSLTVVTVLWSLSKTHLSLVSRKTRPCLTERLLMGRKESNQKLCNKYLKSFMLAKEVFGYGLMDDLFLYTSTSKYYRQINTIDGIHFSSPHYQFVHPREEEEGDNSSETVDSLVLLSNNYIGKTCIHKT